MLAHRYSENWLQNEDKKRANPAKGWPKMLDLLDGGVHQFFELNQTRQRLDNIERRLV